MTSIADIRTLTDLVAFYEEHDRNHDGKLDAAELPALDASTFDEIDANHDKLLSSSELARGRLAPNIFAQLETLNAKRWTFPDATLADQAMINGNEFPAGTRIEFRNNGTPYTVVLGADATIRGHVFSAGTRLMLREDGSITKAWPSKDLVTPEATYKAGEEVRFNERCHGKVSEGMLASDAEFKGIKYKVGTKITFYDTGEVREGTPLSEIRSELNGDEMVFAANERVLMDRNGTVYEGTLVEGERIQGRFMPAGTVLKFEREAPHNLASAKLGDDKELIMDVIASSSFSIQLKRGTEIVFKDGKPERILASVTATTNLLGGSISFAASGVMTIDGAGIFEGTLEADTKVDKSKDIVFKGGTRVRFRGRLPVRGTLAKDAAYAGLLLKADTDVILYPSGEPFIATLAKRVSVRGISFEAGQKVVLSPDGRPLSEVQADDVRDVHFDYMWWKESFVLKVRLSYSNDATIYGVHYQGSEVTLIVRPLNGEDHEQHNEAKANADGVVSIFGKLATATTHQGYRLPNNSDIRFDADGFTAISLDVSTPPAALKLFGGEYIMQTHNFALDMNRRVRSVTPDRMALPITAVVDRLPVSMEFLISFLPQEKVWIRKDGGVEEMGLAEAVQMLIKEGNITADNKSLEILYDEDGSINGINILSDIPLKNGMAIRGGQYFHLPLSKMPFYNDIMSMVDEELARANP